MKKLVTILQLSLILFCGTLVHAQTNFQFTLDAGGSESSGRIIALPNGTYILAGESERADSADIDIVVAQYDSEFNQGWIKTYGGSYQDRFERRGIIPTRDGGFLIGGHSETHTFGRNDAYLIKMDSVGNVQWSKHYGDSLNDASINFYEMPSGDFFVCGGCIPDVSRIIDHFFFLIDAQGNFQWGKRYGDAQIDQAKEMLRSKDGNFVCIGRTESFGAGGSDLTIFKLDSLANKVFYKSYGTPLGDFGYSISEYPNCDLLAVGVSETNGPGTENVHVLRLNSVGDTLWTRSYGGSGVENAWDHKVSPNGDIYICGETNSFGNGGFDAFLICLDSNGTFLWGKTYGSPGNEGFNSLEYVIGGGFVMAGESDSLGGYKSDLYFIRTDSLGNSGGCWEQDVTFSSTWLGVSMSTGGNFAPWGMEDTANTVVSTPFGNTQQISLNGAIALANPLSCHGDSDGVIIASATGATFPYSYNWSNGPTGNVNPGLAGGSYYVIVTAPNGCQDSISFFLPEPQLLTSVGQVLNPIQCFGDSSGVLRINPFGGITPYTFQWSNGQTTQTVDSMPSGFYNAAVIDSMGCRDSIAISLSQPSPLLLNLQSTPDSGMCSGTLTAVISGGVSPYVFQWDSLAGFQTTPTASGLCPGNYCLQVEDSLGCVLDTCQISILVGVDMPSQRILKILPNPVSDVLTVRLPENALLLETGYLSVVNSSGQVLIQKIIQTHENESSIVIQHLPEGVYFLRWKAGQWGETIPFMVQ